MQTIEAPPLADDELAAIDAFWRAANYLSVGQIYLLDNPLLREPLAPEHVKPRLLGHWGTTPGLNLIYAHLTRALARVVGPGRDEREMMYIMGPGHGGPGVVACTWLEGYSVSHAYGAAFDNPDLVVGCVVGDGESETGPLAASWHSNLFLDPARDGAVLPILHLNGYKIANPTVPARIGDDQLAALVDRPRRLGRHVAGNAARERELAEQPGYEPLLVDGNDPAAVHRTMAATVDHALGRILEIQREARSGGVPRRPRWPLIVLRTPKGWTGPVELDGRPVENTWRAHQVPLTKPRSDADERRMLEDWMRSYRPDELFDEYGTPRPQLTSWLPEPQRRMGASPHANGGVLLRDLELPDMAAHAVKVDAPGADTTVQATKVLGRYLAEVFRLNEPHGNFRLFGPDETASNRLDAVYDVTAKAWMGEVLPTDENLAADGRVMEILSEHTCQGWLEGYLLTGRHGLFSCYEAFVHLVDSMFNQHAKWLKTTRELPWRRPIASLNYLLTSHVWRQDHNGFSHQDPGFIDHVVNKKADVIRVYLPPDANTLLSCADHALRSRGYVNVIVAGKQPAPAWLSLDDAVAHCTRGIGIWEWASNEDGDVDVVLACAGDVPTLETLAATDLLRRHLPDVKVRVINVVDLMRLQPETEHPHGLADAEFDALFAADRPVIFAYHGYPWLIHRLTYRRANHRNIHVRGYKEEGTTTTPFDMVVRNDIDRYHLVMDVIDRVPGLGERAAVVRQAMVDERTAQRRYAYTRGEDPPEVRDWAWPG